MIEEYFRNLLIIAVASVLLIVLFSLGISKCIEKPKEPDYYGAATAIDTDTGWIIIHHRIYESRTKTVKEIYDTSEYIIDTIKQTDAGLVLKYRPKKVKIQLAKPIE